MFSRPSYQHPSAYSMSSNGSSSAYLRLTEQNWLPSCLCVSCGCETSPTENNVLSYRCRSLYLPSSLRHSLFCMSRLLTCRQTQNPFGLPIVFPAVRQLRPQTNPRLGRLCFVGLVQSSRLLPGSESSLIFNTFFLWRPFSFEAVFFRDDKDVRVGESPGGGLSPTPRSPARISCRSIKTQIIRDYQRLCLGPSFHKAAVILFSLH